MTATQVALIVDKLDTTDLHQLTAAMPVWILDSLIDEKSLHELRWHSPFSVTTFNQRSKETKPRLVERIAYSIDEHHNETSQDPPYRELRVIGAQLRDVDQRTLSEIGFVAYVPTQDGFIASKP